MQKVILFISAIVLIETIAGCKITQNDRKNISGRNIDVHRSSVPVNCIDSARIDQNAMCIQVYDPVCGCDGKTYSNSCMANIAGISEWTNGECK